MKLWPLAVLGPLVVIAAAAWAFSKNHSSTLPTEQYATRADAEAHAAFAPVPQGWLPAMIPAGAMQIRTAYNPPTHQTWGEFLAPREGFIPEGTAKVAPTELMLLGAPVTVLWWPAFLRGRIASADLQAQGFALSFLETEASPLIVAVRGKQVYWWRLARQ